MICYGRPELALPGRRGLGTTVSGTPTWPAGQGVIYVGS